MWEAKYLKKSAIYCWKSTEIRQKLQFFFICPSLKPHKIQMIKDYSKFQKHGTWFITWLHFLFFNLSSKPHGCPLKEADLETVKVVNFATKWLNLYPRTVLRHGSASCLHKNIKPRKSASDSKYGVRWIKNHGFAEGKSMTPSSESNFSLPFLPGIP